MTLSHVESLWKFVAAFSAYSGEMLFLWMGQSCSAISRGGTSIHRHRTGRGSNPVRTGCGNPVCGTRTTSRNSMVRRSLKGAGRAGLEAKTIHRLLEIDAATGRFSKNESNTLACGLVVVDETSMVDVPLMHSLLRAVPNSAKHRERVGSRFGNSQARSAFCCNSVFDPAGY